MASPLFHANPPQNDTGVVQLQNPPPPQPPSIMYHKLFGRNGVVSEPTTADHHNCNTVALARSSVPLGPFTGYAAILKRSSFLRPAQQLLDEFFGSGHRVPGSEAGLTLSSEYCVGLGSDRVGYNLVNSRLVFMLQEVCKRCKLYCQQIESVVTSFEAVAGLGNAAPYICYAIKAISTQFGSFKNLILAHLRNINNRPDVNVVAEDREIPRLLWTATSKRGGIISHQIPTQNLANNNLPSHSSVWQSRRGLPDNAVLVLKKWLFDHFLHPYPTDSEKEMLAQQTGLSRTQVSNWFINSRVRLWKPMVEEINALQTHKNQEQESTCSNSNYKRSRNENDNKNNNNGTRSNSNRSDNSASWTLDLQPNTGYGPSQAFYRPITHTFDVVPSVDAGFKNWF